MQRSMPALLVLLLAAFVSGCATGRYSVPLPAANLQVRDDQALVVFMRPSNLGYSISSSVFDLTDDGERILAIPGPNEKVGVYLTPGVHRFMVIAENADFVDATLLPGRVYYAVITPRMGMWKARFSLHPIKRQPSEPEFAVDGGEFLGWVRECASVESSASVVTWGAENAASVHAKRVEDLPRWLAKPEQERRVFTLAPEDGLLAPL